MQTSGWTCCLPPPTGSTFRLVIIGGGPLADEAVAFARSRPWVWAVGPKFDHDKSVLLSMASMWLNPGALGLAILDAFCAGLPLLTTRQPTHGPEIEYLQHGENGLLLDDTAEAFADGMLRLLREPGLAVRLRDGAARTAHMSSPSDQHAISPKYWTGIN